MAAGAFSDEFLLRSTEPTQKEKKEKKMNNLAVPGPRTNAQGSNRPFGRGPLTLILDWIGLDRPIKFRVGPSRGREPSGK